MSNITINLKRLGKKKIHTYNINIEKNPENLQDFIEQCVTSEWNRFKVKTEDRTLISFLTTEKIQDYMEGGKVGFGDMENREITPLPVAINNAITGFKDGLFVVFINDTELKSLEQPIQFNPASTFTFIRLTFLTGTYWS